MSMSERGDAIYRVDLLLKALGIESSSFWEFVEWALSEQIVRSLAQAVEKSNDKQYFAKPDSLRQFRNLLRNRTGTGRWNEQDLELVYQAVKMKFENHYREPLQYGEYLRLLWTVPHCCTQCGKEPPEIKLHVDHIVPASLGGRSKRHNIQFLCEDCNLRKSNKLQEGKPWLQLW